MRNSPSTERLCFKLLSPFRTRPPQPTSPLYRRSKGADSPQDFRLRATRTRRSSTLGSRDSPPGLVVAFSSGGRAVYCFSSLRSHFEGYRGYLPLACIRPLSCVRQVLQKLI